MTHSVELQVKLLRAGLCSLRPGGLLVYSTCSIWPKENDDVIDDALSHEFAAVEIVTHKLQGLTGTNGVSTRHGRLWLPDAQVLGPVFLAALRKHKHAKK
jgi:16S rRNA C967 or C1407 C5-methylase (RsmB/RsmF family)